MTIAWHHGTCDECKERLKFLMHLGYDKENNGYRVCEDCLFSAGIAPTPHPDYKDLVAWLYNKHKEVFEDYFDYESNDED